MYVWGWKTLPLISLVYSVFGGSVVLYGVFSQSYASKAVTGDTPLPLASPIERFMDSQVDINGHFYELIPFGTGRRICPGMPLAMRMVPVMVGSLINCFDRKLEGGILPEKLDMEEKFGITLAKLQPLRAVATLVVL
ncbi:Geraniol 10-hydroxylase [Heracleum sosnowskyi]|uniref:Geraniol 10-hydroxylase n=1 Tax=Heracleum sosnowskyi TaxID=360622 RepID=A0AAD8M2Z5_9APIA|nr:Geraniol 10-hydroxylase [Heracleum sosnowskyi]